MAQIKWCVVFSAILELISCAIPHQGPNVEPVKSSLDPGTEARRVPDSCKKKKYCRNGTLNDSQTFI
jgi:hypothetical protein